MSENKTNISELGEFGLIDHLTSKFELKNRNSLLGVGDDAAVIDVSEEEAMLVSTDLLVEGIHFNLMYMPLKHLGYKAVAVNVSDICAMNGTAEQITVSLAVSSRFPLEALEELYEGIHLACAFYNVDLIGGDTTSSVSGLAINITVMGRAKKSEITYRSGAKEFDLLVVTGDLGAAYMGLQVLEREKEVFKANPAIQPDLDGHDYIIERQLKPEARKDIIGFLKELDVVPTSMIAWRGGRASVNSLLGVAKMRFRRSRTCGSCIRFRSWADAKPRPPSSRVTARRCCRHTSGISRLSTMCRRSSGMIAVRCATWAAVS